MSKKKLFDITLHEISLVDEPANQHAKVTLFKNAGSSSKSQREVNSMSEEMKKQLDDLNKKVEKLESEAEALTKNDESVMKQLADLDIEVNKADDGSIKLTKKATPEYILVDGEKVEKGSVPEALLKRLETLEKAQEAEAFAKRAEAELPNLAGTAESKGKLIKAVDGLDEADKTAITEALKAADKAVGTLFSEIGKGQGDEADPEVQLENMAKKLADEKSIDFSKAYADVLDSKEGQALYAKMRGGAN
jgi:chaperonin cofactor prefoldin